MSDQMRDQSDICGCCDGSGVETPVAIDNRPGLPAVTYRVGTYASFRRSLLAHLSDGRFPALQQLRTREDDDFTIALLDAWAVTGDVLTFYQERMANEAYLRTATERLSILELARLLGYRLAPGLAAGTYLAFTMETTPGAPELAPKPVQLTIGTGVQSVPGPDELPQSFETIEAIEARVEWNAILPQLTEPQTLAWDMEMLWLAGANIALSTGDVLLIIAETEGAKQAAIRRVAKVTPDTAANRTQVALGTISLPAMTELSDDIANGPPGVFVMRASATPFGHNAPKESTYTTDGTFDEFREWQLDPYEQTNLLTLSARNEKILPGSLVVIGQFDLKDSDAEEVLSEPLDPGDLTWTWMISKVFNVTHLSVARYGMAGSGTMLMLTKGWKRISESLLLLRSMTVAAQSEALAAAALPVTYPVYGATLPLNGLIDGLLPGRPLAVSGKRQQLRIADQASASIFGSVELPGSGTIPWIQNLEDALRSPLLFLEGGERVELKPGDRLGFLAPPIKVVGFRLIPISPPEFGILLSASAPAFYLLWLIDRDGRSGAALLYSTWFALDAAEDGDQTIREIAFIDDASATAISHDRDRSTLQLAKPLAGVYDRATMRINANVAAATHGESVYEPLGSGDATISHQSFLLAQTPLTYVSADTPSGSASTLKIYVNDVLWEEALFLHGRGANEHIYITRQDDEGRTTVCFGDGVNGARLPTGQDNVRAEYRKGSGLGGLVQAEQLSQLMSRPLGLGGVTNPEAAQGAEDPESRDAARKNAPTTVLTLDRAVSLQDYEDFARTFAGIAKAQAVWVWDGRRRTVFITVAGPGGAPLEEEGAVMANLKEALHQYGDPFVVFTIKSYRPVLFQIHGTVTVAPDHVAETVLAEVTADLRQRYAFDVREFGQLVALSDVVAAIQSIAGVVAVDIDNFYRNDAPTPPIRPRLSAAHPAMGADGIVPAAEILLIDETSLTQLKAVQ
jgi:hypothetical protein